MLNYDTYGPEDAPSLLIAHGLFGSGRNWRAIAKRLSAEFRVTTIDMRNHADSFWSDEMTYPTMAQDLAEVIEATHVPAIVMGHSMGGKAAMTLALTRPELVERLIIADIAPVRYTHSHAHLIDAMQAVDMSKIEKRADVGDALSDTVDDPALRAFFLQSVEIKDGRAKWLLNLAALKNSMPQIIGWPDITGSYSGPTLFVAGANSDYVDEKGRAAIKPLFPNARFAKLKDAGHWLHADQPRAFVETLRLFSKG